MFDFLKKDPQKALEDYKRILDACLVRVERISAKMRYLELEPPPIKGDPETYLVKLALFAHENKSKDPRHEEDFAEIAQAAYDVAVYLKHEREELAKLGIDPRQDNTKDPWV